MPTYSMEEAKTIKKLKEQLRGKEHQIVEYWGKKGTFYVRKKPEVRKNV